MCLHFSMQEEWMVTTNLEYASFYCTPMIDVVNWQQRLNCSSEIKFNEKIIQKSCLIYNPLKKIAKHQKHHVHGCDPPFPVVWHSEIDQWMRWNLCQIWNKISRGSSISPLLVLECSFHVRLNQCISTNVILTRSSIWGDIIRFVQNREPSTAVEPITIFI